MTIEKIRKEIERREYAQFMYLMADRYTPSERAEMNENNRKLWALRAELEQLEKTLDKSAEA